MKATSRATVIWWEDELLGTTIPDSQMSTSASNDYRYKQRERSEGGWVLDQELYCIQSRRMMLESQLYQKGLGMHVARTKVRRLKLGVKR